MSDQFLYTSPADPRAQPLIAELGWEYDQRYGEFYSQSGEPREMQKYPPATFTPAEGGNFLLLLRAGVAVAGGAFKRLDTQTAEFKRIWTDQRLRRQGLASRVLVELEAQALRQGYLRVYLTTGFRQPEAVALYRGHGYRGLFDPDADGGEQPVRRYAFDKALRAADDTGPVATNPSANPLAHALGQAPPHAPAHTPAHATPHRPAVARSTA